MKDDAGNSWRVGKGFIALAVFQLPVLAACAVVALFVAPASLFAAQTGAEVDQWLVAGAIALCGGALALVLFPLAVAAGVGLMRGRRWGRRLGFVAALIALLEIPFGTIAGIYALLRLRRLRLSSVFLPLCSVLLAGAAFPARAQDGRIEEIRRLYQKVEGRVAASESGAKADDPADRSAELTCDEFMVNRNNNVVAAVGDYRSSVKFYYAKQRGTDDVERDALVKVNVRTEVSDRRYFEEYLFNPAGALVFYHKVSREGGGGGDPPEERYYFWGGALIRAIIGDATRDRPAREDAEAARRVLEEARALRAVFEQTRALCGGSAHAAARTHFVITLGALFEEGDRYEEHSRFTVTVEGSNPTVSEILAEVRRQPQEPHMERLKPHFYLMHPETRERLDESKRASAYRLRDGSRLWLMTSVR